MNAIFAAAKEVVDFMRVRGWKVCVIGGLAVQRWGEPRLTQDADLTLLTGFGNENLFARELLTQFTGRRDDALDFAVMNRVLLIRSSNRMPVDVSFGALPFEVGMLERATPFDFAPECTLPTCSAEDLFIMKVFAGRPQDWLDVRGIAVRQTGRLDRGRILTELKELCDLKETPEAVEQARQILEGSG